MKAPCLDLRPGHRQPRARQRLALGLCLLSSPLSSCFSPSYSQAIYLCDNKACPAGLSCSSDGVCVDLTAAGCFNGGIQAGDQLYLCPGRNNRCQTGWGTCPTPPMGLACPPPPAMPGIASPPCAICCPSPATTDMSPPAG
jgi:hypothetical protein